MNRTSFYGVGFDLEQLNARIIYMWTRDRIVPAQFYRTGFETICLNHSRKFALESVLSSVVPCDKKIVIIGNVKSGEVAAVAGQFDITNIVFDAEPDEMLLFETFLHACEDVSHVVLVIDRDDDRIERYVQYLFPLLHNYGIGLILFCASSVENIHDRTNGCLDYMIGGWDEMDENSFVVARRNQLVQIEGNSRSLTHDLYAFWQLSLLERKSDIAPMEM
jgi:hypothetical protein